MSVHMLQSFFRGSIQRCSLSRRQHTAAFLNQRTQLFFHVFREEGCSAQFQKFRFHAQEPGDHLLCGFFGDSTGRCEDQEIFSTKVTLLPVHRQRKLLLIFRHDDIDRKKIKHLRQMIVLAPRRALDQREILEMLSEFPTINENTSRIKSSLMSRPRCVE